MAYPLAVIRGRNCGDGGGYLKAIQLLQCGASDLQGSCPEVGNAEKTIFLCDYLSSRETQYEVNDGLQVVENWNSTNEFICYGRHGEMATNSREQQEATTRSLQLLQNCLMLINTDPNSADD